MVIGREQLLEVGVRELQARGSKATTDPLGTMEAIANGLGLRDTVRPRSCLFVRRTSFVPVEVAARFDVVIVCARIESSQTKRRIVLANRDPGWYAAVRARGTEVVIWDWMIPPGLWRRGLVELVAFGAAVGAVALCLNVEPASGDDKGTARDWRGRHAEVDAYATTARDLCDSRGLEVWVTSWADPPPNFGLRELVRHAHLAIPQPYEVHGREGEEYVEGVLEEWHGAGADLVILGRGAHELDRSDDDAWRTPAEILEHRASTPVGMGEAWWVPAGPLARRTAEIDAMLAPLEGQARSSRGGSPASPK